MIFWTLPTGAGRSRADQRRLGQAQRLGGTARRACRRRIYRGNLVSAEIHRRRGCPTHGSKTFTTVPARARRTTRRAGVPDDPRRRSTPPGAPPGPLGPLGAAQGAPYPIGATASAELRGRRESSYSTTPASRERRITGQVLAKYCRRRAGREGDLPACRRTSEVDGGLATESRMSSFAAEDEPVIFWTPELRRCHRRRGAMAAAWKQAGRRNGFAWRCMRPDRERRRDHAAIQRRRESHWDRSKEYLQHRAARTWRRRCPTSRCRDRICPGAALPAGLRHQRQQVVCTGAGGGCSRSFRCWSWPGWVAVAALRNRRRGRDGWQARTHGDDELGHGAASRAYGAVRDRWLT